MSVKKVSIMFLVLLLVVSLFAGCSQPAEKPEEPNGNGEETESGVKKPEGYPSKDIHWIVPAPAGAALDLPTRVVADILNLGKSVVVENIGGGSQTIGTAEAYSRPGDGHTLLTMANACGFTQPIMTDVSYDIEELRHIVMLAPFVQGGVFVRKDSDIKDIDDWLALLDSGKKYTYGVTNAGGFGHMSIASTLSQLGHYGDGKETMVVYEGSAENIAALMSGEPDFIIADAPDVLSHVESGDFRPIVILHDEKCDLYPDTPVISDYGVENMSTFVGMKWVSVRKDTPDEIVEWLKQELNAAIQTKEYQDYLEKAGFGELKEYSEEEVNEIVQTGIKDYGDVLRITGLAK